MLSLIMKRSTLAAEIF